MQNVNCPGTAAAVSMEAVGSSSREGFEGTIANQATYNSDIRASQQEGYGGEDLPGPDSWALLFGSQDPAGVLQLSCRHLDFGGCSRLSAVGQQSFTVTNTSAAKLLVFVAVPSWHDLAGNGGGAAAGGQQVFQVRSLRILAQAEGVGITVL
jgi:hypothetical protein